MSRDKTIAVLWKSDHPAALPTRVLFVRFSGRIQFYWNVSRASVMRLEQIRQKGDKRIRWEQPGEVDRYIRKQMGVTT